MNNLSYSKEILNATLKATCEENNNETFECIPMLLSNRKIAYFHPSHDVIDITALLYDDNANPQKKNASDVKKGDRILIRQSGKGIIHEKADELMSKNHEINLRQQSERWIKILQAIALKLSIKEIVEAITEFGGTCIYQQLRYWLTGEAICPRKKQTLIAIGKIYEEYYRNERLDSEYLNEIDNIYEAGNKIHTYHQQAGRWLTKELKDKANEIKTISKIKDSKGIIDGIGEITIYKIEDILEKTEVSKWELNKIEDLY